MGTQENVKNELAGLLTGQRCAWLAGTRGEALTMAGFFKHCHRGGSPLGPGFWFSSSEHGMALHQALDWAGVIPDEVAPQCHPSEEPAQRLAIMMERAEAFGRQRKAQRIIFSGWGPTAVGGALYAHSRGGGGVWLRPPDPAGVIPRLRWEGGIERMIRALAPAVKVIELDALPWLAEGAAAVEAVDLRGELPGFEPEAPRCVIAMLRREWGLFDDTFTRLARAVAACARERPEWRFVMLSLLNARLERPMRTLPEAPANLHLAPPLPQGAYRALLAGARGVVTDSPLTAGEALALGVPAAVAGEGVGDGAAPGSARAGVKAVAMEALLTGCLGNWLTELG